jgi:hypothetical protein
MNVYYGGISATRDAVGMAVHALERAIIQAVFVS